MTTPDKDPRILAAIVLTGITIGGPLGYWIGDISSWWMVPAVVLTAFTSLVGGLVVEIHLYGTSIRQAWRDLLN